MITLNWDEIFNQERDRAGIQKWFIMWPKGTLNHRSFTRNLLPMIVPLARQLLASLSDVGGLMCTCTAMAILRWMHVCILARLSANNRHEALVAYSLSLARREDTTRREIGYRTRDTTTGVHHPSIDERCNLKIYVKRGDKYDDVMFSICQMISNTNLAISLQESTSDIIALEGINDETEEIGVGVIGTDSSKHMLYRFASLPDEEKHPIDLYAVQYEQAVLRITSHG
jgi:hypothetical protein